MEKRFWKPVDPNEFKQADIENLSERVEEKRERARRFLDRADVEVDECYVCGSTEADPVREMYGYTFQRCRNCTHVYLGRRLPQDDLYDYYETDSDFASTYTDEEQIEYRLENIVKPKVNYVLDHVDADEGRWLDVGCGIGGSLAHIESEGWDAVGLDISQESVAVARERFGVDVREQTLSDFVETNPDAEFDVVSFFGYLEMVPHPMVDLEFANELLDDDGTVAFGGMNADSVSSLVHRAMPDRAVRHSIPPVGLSQFTFDSINEAFERTGFSPVAAWFFGLDFYELMNHLRLAADGFDDSDLADYLTARLNDFQRVIDEDEKSDYQIVVGRTT